MDKKELRVIRILLFLEFKGSKNRHETVLDLMLANSGGMTVLEVTKVSANVESYDFYSGL